ncbi:DUF3429 domain-containing protein [Sphingomonas sp. Tas61C01]|uniref:DUF3429 domain-containing protein n=1 Tax=Sphingomonas sp. Tas61C01 TaxID=3458297 RepID=UPI00403ECE9F
MTTEPVDDRPRVSQAAMLLGFAGLAPQFAAVTMIALGRSDLALPVAVAYPLIILSFLGGIWWGFAVRRRESQASLAALAVVPSLVAMGLLAMATITGRFGLLLIGTGVALLMTLIVDRHLARSGDAPADWLRLRVPLSVGLGGLTIVAGFMVP